MHAGWTATEYVRDADLSNLNAIPYATICRMQSPFYKGVKWAVRRGGSCLSKKGEWVYEPLPSSRTESFYKRCRFDTFEAAESALRKCEGK